MAVEVKTRRSDAFGSPLEAVTRVKLARLRRLAAAWLSAQERTFDGVRIDVVGVTLPRAGAAVLTHRARRGVIGRTRSVVLTGVVGHVIEVEAHLAPSLPAFTLVGLPDASLNESRDRVRAAVTSSGLSWPQRRITVNLSPASLPKSGSVTDLAIAVAVLAGAGLDRRAPSGERGPPG